MLEHPHKFKPTFLLLRLGSKQTYQPTKTAPMKIKLKTILISLSLLLSPSTWSASKEKTFYTQQAAWQQLQQQLPLQYQLTPASAPQEYFWPWRAHQIHVDAYPNTKAHAKVILVHGVGTNGRQLSLILGHPLAQSGYETLAPDLPGYGLTQVSKPKQITYDDWVQALSDFVDREAAKDSRPIFLYGLSAGGMLSLHTAMQNPNVRGVIGMTFLDQRHLSVKKSTMRFSGLSGVSLPALKVSAKTPLKNLRLPMRWVSKMKLLSNDPVALKIMLADKTSAGNAMSIGFLNSYLNYQPKTDISALQHSPVLLTQPAQDQWTPLASSQPVLDQLKVPFEVVILPEGGHYPVEPLALAALKSSTIQFIEKYSGPTQHQSVSPPETVVLD